MYFIRFMQFLVFDKARARGNIRCQVTSTPTLDHVFLGILFSYVNILLKEIKILCQC